MASTLSDTLAGPLGVFPILKTCLSEGGLNSTTASHQAALERPSQLMVPFRRLGQVPGYVGTSGKVNKALQTALRSLL